MFERLFNAITKYDTIIIHRHGSPDGDAVGSQTGLKFLIKDNFPGKTVYTVGDAAGRYSFMEGSEADIVPDAAFCDALAIILDSAERGLVSDERYRTAAYSIRIDHHIYCDTFTDEEIVDTSFESCAGMIADFAMEQGLTLSERSATALYTGMTTDSGRFRYDSISPRTFELAAFLLKAGINTEKLYRSLYCDTLENVKLRASFAGKIRIFDDSPVAYIYTTADELASTGRDAFSVSRGMVGIMSDIKGIDIWVNFTESEGKVLCELRSSRYNINPVAVKYGGGGHKKACGADVKNYDEAIMMLSDLKKLTEQGNE
ncbi:MAG: bifunctional oligoribonuclease/PAP phosphatase NrnA [Clostridia bacterium]|nr:bifunctional oligoribonuclease/PAP phosphatase NrnA [Clostridia bacterium]